MAEASYGYFDEAYFQQGEARGTAYSNYLESSKTSALYREIAEVCAAFRPVRALEIGCATGIIVKHLNNSGIETHGIDVSEWAIANREHPNVVLSGAEKLPFPDNHFDLIYSVHALEHIPTELKDAAFAEIGRVARKDAFHFHTLPIIGLGPYVGQREAVIQQLKKDPTHNLLFEQPWWLENFEQIGFSEFGAHVIFAGEDQIDLSDSQLLLCGRETSDSQKHAAQQRLRAHNLKALANLQARTEAQRVGLKTNAVLSPAVSMKLENNWGDLAGTCDLPIRENTLITAQVSIKTALPKMTLRFCFIGQDGEEADITREFKNGTTVFQFKPPMMTNRKAQIIGARAKQWYFGGNGQGEVSAAFAFEG